MRVKPVVKSIGQHTRMMQTQTSQKSGASPDAPRKMLAGCVVLLGEPEEANVGVIRAHLRGQGVAEVRWRRSVDGVAKAIEDGGVDLALVDLSLPGGDPLDLIRRLRHGVLAADPFLPLIVTTRTPDDKVILAALDVGADDVLLKPVGANDLAKRIRRIGASRKPFVAAADYVGPIRAGMEDLYGPEDLIDPPNPLGGPQSRYSPDAVQKLEDARRRMASARLAACAREAGESIQARLLTAQTWQDDGSLTAIATKLAAISTSSPFASLAPIVARLAALVEFSRQDSQDARRAGKLAVEIAEMLVLAVTAHSDRVLDLPMEIVERVDARFPELGFITPRPR